MIIKCFGHRTPNYDELALQMRLTDLFVCVVINKLNNQFFFLFGAAYQSANKRISILV